MTGVLTGFGIIGAVIAAGYLIGRTGVAGEHARHVLSRLAFYAFTPSLLLTVLADADIHMLLSSVLVASAVAALTVAVVFALVAKLAWKRSVSETVIGSLASGYVNSNNMGIPVAVYVLGDPAFVAPVMLFQLLILSPIALTILEVQNRMPGPRWRMLIQPFLNPLIMASAIGLAISAFEIPVPPAVLEPLRLIGAAAVPTVLFAFGISLHGQRVFAAGVARRDIIVASLLKLLAMPLIAWGIGRFALHLDSPHLFAVVALAALPTAQNVYTYAQRYGHGEAVARDTAFVTTIGALPALLATAALLHP